MISTPLTWLCTLSYTYVCSGHIRKVFPMRWTEKTGEMSPGIASRSRELFREVIESWRWWIWAFGSLTPHRTASVARILIVNSFPLSSSICPFFNINIILLRLTLNMSEVSPLGKDFVSESQVDGQLCWKRVRFKILLNVFSNLFQQDNYLHTCPQVSVSPWKSST